jgi:hypothetical protein
MSDGYAAQMQDNKVVLHFTKMLSSCLNEALLPAGLLL